MDNNIKKGLITVFSANIINLIFNLLTNFLLPKYLSFDSYAAIKTFQLYTTYIGVFALGCADGMYLRYGGKKLDLIDQNELKTGVGSFRIMMLIESLIFIPISFIVQDKVLIAFSFTIMSMNITSYYKNLYQAVGEFKKYGKILNLTTIATFLINMVLLFGLRSDDYFLYLIGYAVIDAGVWILLEINSSKILSQTLNQKTSVSVKLLWDDTKSGFLLMVGNFSNILLSSMDRWFVKVMMDSAQFAYYSFAVSMEGFLNIAITPITTTFYNYFCNHREVEDVNRVRRYALLFGTVIVATAFPAKFIIEIFLVKYKESATVLFILFSAQILYVMIKGVYVNLYKAFKKQNLYFLRLVVVLIIGVILNAVFVRIYSYKEAFAWGTLVSAFIWLLMCIFDFRQYSFELREWLYVLFEIFGFLACGIAFPSVIGCVVYVTLTAIFMFLFMRREVMNLLSMAKSYCWH